MFFPDFEGIEIKCNTKYSNYPLYLFTVSFDGPTFPEINRIIDLYDYPDKDFSNKKVLFTKLNFNKINTTKSNYKMKLEIDKNNEKIFLKVFDNNDNFIEKESYVYLKSIYDHLMVKLQKLAVINAYRKRIKNEDYFRYYMIKIYELISYEKFIELLENDYIVIDLIARINKSGVDEGRHRNKNLVFSIRKQNIEMLFNKIYELNMDEKKRYSGDDFFIMPASL